MQGTSPLRVVVIGVSGSGKTSFATRLAKQLDLKQIELDLLNWRPNWHDRYVHEFEAFEADVLREISDPEWVLAGGYSKVRAMIFARANTVVWLDLPKTLVLRQVIWRSIRRAVSRKPILNGNYESFLRWFNTGHPIQIVWRHYARKTQTYKAQLAAPDAAHLRVFQCKSRADVEETLRSLARKT